MQDNLKPYPQYKESDIPWIGLIPNHWETHKIRHTVSLLISNVDKLYSDNEIPVKLCNYTDVYKNERITERLKFMKASASKDEVIKFKIKVGDVIITKDSESWDDIGIPSLVTFEEAYLLCGYHLAILRPKNILNGNYLFRLLQNKNISYQFHLSANGVTRYGLSHNSIKNIRIIVPPIPEQHQIARYLDWKTTQISKFIKAKKLLIELLKEQKQVIINDAVTGKIDVRTGKHYPKYKDSGVEWLGMVPEEWEVRKLKFLVKGKLKYGANASGVEYSNLLPRYIRITDFDSDGKISDTRKLSLSAEFGNEYLVEEGDILYARSGATFGKSFQCKELKEPSCFAGYLIKAAPDQSIITSDFLYNYNQSLAFELWKNYSFIKATIENIGADKYAQLLIAFPKIDLQLLINNWISEKTHIINSSILKIENELVLIQEYLTRLIADVVTGKVDVRDIVVPVTAIDKMDEEVDETDIEENEEQTVNE